MDMKISPVFKAYINQQINWRSAFLTIIIELVFLALYFATRFRISWLYYLPPIYFTLLFLVVFVDMAISRYINFKEYDYGKTKIPDDISKIKSEVSPDVWAIIKHLEERVVRVEKESPIRWMFISIFFTLFLTVAVSIALYILPKILPH